MGTILKRLSFASILMLGTGSLAMSANGQVAAWEPDLLPSNPQVGKCYGRVQIPARYTTTEERVLISQAYTKTEVSQPRLSSRREQVLAKEASVRFEVRQPRFKTVSEQVLVRPSYEKLSVTPPKFNTVTETIQTSTSRLVWKLGNPIRLTAQGYKVHSVADGRIRSLGYSGGYGSSSSNLSGLGGYQGLATSCGETCEIWCLVEEPGESVSFNRRVMTSSGTVRRINVPAKYTSISKQIVADPGGVREIPVPAEYRNVMVETVVDPGREYMVNIPPVYGLIDKRTLIAPSRYEWRQVVCGPRTLRSSSTLAGHYSSRKAHNAASHSNSGGYSTRTATTYSGTASRSQSRTHTGQIGTTQSGRSYYYGTNKPVKPHVD